MKKNRIYFIQDVFDEVSKLGYEDKAIRDLYYFIVDYLRDRILKESDVAYFFPKFGTIFLTLTGVNYTLKFVENGKNANKELYIDSLNKKKKTIETYIEKLKLEGNNSIAYFNRIFNFKYIKNKDNYEQKTQT